MQRWSARACGWLRLDVQLHGVPSPATCVYVANHRSYLDVPVLSSVLGASFMSRADVAGWPVVGAVARDIGAVFVNRDDAHGRARAALALVRRLETASVVVFPEGTTGGARLPGPFHPGLFRLLHRTDARVVPVTIRYSDRRAYWTDDVSMSDHLRTRVFGVSRLAAAVHVGEGFGAREHADAASLAGAVYRAVCRPIDELGEGTVVRRDHRQATARGLGATNVRDGDLGAHDQSSRTGRRS